MVLLLRHGCFVGTDMTCFNTSLSSDEGPDTVFGHQIYLYPQTKCTPFKQPY